VLKYGLIFVSKITANAQKQNFKFYKWLFVLQIENDIFTNTHIFVKTNTQNTNRQFAIVDSKTRVQFKAKLRISYFSNKFKPIIKCPLQW